MAEQPKLKGQMIEIVDEHPHLDDDVERVLRPMRVTGQRLKPREK